MSNQQPQHHKQPSQSQPTRVQAQQAQRHEEPKQQQKQEQKQDPPQEQEDKKKPVIPQQSELAQFDFKIPTVSHSISSSISSMFSQSSSEMGNGDSWSPCTTHQSKSSDGDQFVHAQTSDLPPLPQTGKPGSPQARYAFAKTATARKLSMIHHVNPRISTISNGAVQAQPQTGAAVVAARPSLITVTNARPKTSSGVPGSPGFRKSNVPPMTEDNLSVSGHQERKLSAASGIGLGLAIDLENTNSTTIINPPSGSASTTTSPATTTTTVTATRPAPRQSRSTNCTPVFNNRAETPSLSRRRTDLDQPPSTSSGQRKFSLFPCPQETPIIIRDSPGSPPPQSMAARSISVSSQRPRTAGGADTAAEDWIERPLPPLPPGFVAAAAGSTMGSKPVKAGREKSEKEKSTFKSIKKQLSAGFQSFSKSLKIKSHSSEKEKPPKEKPVNAILARKASTMKLGEVHVAAI